MMRRKKQMMILAVAAGVSAAGSVYAAEQTEMQEHSHALEETVVTAQRRSNRDFDTPATTTIITAKEIEKAGYRNVFEAIDQQIGSTSTSYGETGQDFGFSSGRITLRGYDRGTLVMVNGTPMNLKNYSSTENIPASMVERIEIVKGASSTLYGANAMGGVVNVILKKAKEGASDVRLSQTLGNSFKKSEAVYAGDGIVVDISREWSKDVPHANAFGIDKVSWTDWWVGKGKKSRIGVMAHLTDEISMNYNYMEGDITRGGTLYRKAGNALVRSRDYNYRYEDFRHTASLSYQGKENGIRAVLGYNYRKVDGFDFVAGRELDSNASVDSQIFDVQKNWSFGKDSVIAGYSYQREAIFFPTTGRDRTRTGNAVYLSYGKQITPKFHMTLGVRGEWINDATKNQNVFMPQVQTNYRFDRNASWYVNVGKAFQMPAIDANLNYTVIHTDDVRPEYGWTYETGVKVRRGNDMWKAAVYHMDMKDKIGWKRNASNEYYPVNMGNFRNTGVEVEYTKRFNAAWTLVLGAGVSNPEIQNPSSRNRAWTQDAGRIEGLIRLNYEMEKWNANMNFKYLGDREYYAPTSGTAQDVPDKMQCNLNVVYRAGADDTVALGIYNLFNRENYSNRYGNLDLGRNFRLTYTHAF